ncbi:MAG: DUF4435 domain-containing protein [Rhodocyclales bacterium]|nr:DUF4435 domain-containing protein [Rhodocyclales bacterium]
MIQWPKRALGAVRKLFEPLQDIDVYVEDANDEVFYTQLLKRVAPNHIRIVRVFALGNRQAVVDKANAHDSKARPALFIIDGDLEWVSDLPLPSSAPCLYRLDAYCIENLLLCDKAAAKVLMEEKILAEDESHRKLDFQSWKASIQEPLIELFSAFAVLHQNDPSQATVSTGVGPLCTVHRSTKVTVLSPKKAERKKLEALRHAANNVNEAAVNAQYRRIHTRASGLPVPLDIVSGKDFLLPLLGFLLQAHGCRVRTKVLRYRLALACELERFSGIRQAMEHTVSEHL